MRFVRYWAPVILLCAVIFFLSGLPPDSLPRFFDFPFKDKIGHFGIYGALGFLVSRAASWHQRLEREWSWRAFRRSWVMGILFCVAYGIFDEYRQSFTPGREVEFLDLVANTLGGVVGGILAFQYRRIVSRYERARGAA